jgi:hypothetical protein
VSLVLLLWENGRFLTFFNRVGLLLGIGLLSWLRGLETPIVALGLQFGLGLQIGKRRYQKKLFLRLLPQTFFHVPRGVACRANGGLKIDLFY